MGVKIMKNNKSSIKQLALRAKRRLALSNESTKNVYSKMKIITSDNYKNVIINNDDDDLYEKVKTILQEENVYNPLKKLTDEKLFNTLSEEKKQAYIINLSEKFNNLKIRYEKETKLA